MAATAMLDLFSLFVEEIFGSVLLSGIGLTILFLVMGMFMRMSPLTLSMLVAFFVMVFAIGYVGEIALLMVFIPAVMWFIIGLGRFIMRRLEAY